MSRNNSLIFQVMTLCILILMLCNVTGCTHYKKRKALESYIKQVKSRPIKEIEPLPEVKPYESFTYNNMELRNPFVPSVPVEMTKKMGTGNGIRPDIHRRKEPLENFPLDSLRMVGVLEQHGKRWAIILDSDGVVHRVTRGNYVGQHDGKIDEVQEERVVITEIMTDGADGWREKKSSIALREEESGKRKTGKK